MQKKGMVYLIGAGPGDPGLFTLKGKQIMEQADVVVYDRLIGPEILELARPDAEMIYVGKASSDHALPQEQINALLVEKAMSGKLVARLKGGDPFVFGRGGEEALFVREHGIDFAVVPGITSAIAVPAYAGIPVTHRDASSSFAVITGHEKPGKSMSSIHWDKIATGIGTLVFLMGVENLAFIVENLLAAGRSQDTPVALIRRGTFPDQAVLTGTLADIVAQARQADFKPPAIVVVGETVALRNDLRWREQQPLWGARIVVTRARAQASSLVERIRLAGGEAIEFPSINIVRSADLNPLHAALGRLTQYRWIIFTSVNGVDIFFEEMSSQGIDIRELRGVKICAIGPATASRLAQRGLIVELIPEEYRAEGILAALKDNLKPGEHILLPRAQGAREILPAELREWGVMVDEVETYQAKAVESIDPGQKEKILRGEADYLTFTSSSTVSNFVKILGADKVNAINASVKVACIGPVTAATAREFGFEVNLMPAKYTIDALLEVIIQDYHHHQADISR